MTKQRELEKVVADALNRTRERAEGEFDGLMGTLPKDTAGLIQAVTNRMREVVLEEMDEDEARAALQSPAGRLPGHSPRASLALGILGMIGAASQTGQLADKDKRDWLEAAGLDSESQLAGRATLAARKRQRKGGSATAVQRSAEAKARCSKWIQEGQRLLDAGRAKHEITAILCKQHGVGPKAMRTALQNGGVLPPRKSRPTK